MCVVVSSDRSSLCYDVPTPACSATFFDFHSFQRHVVKTFKTHVNFSSSIFAECFEPCTKVHSVTTASQEILLKLTQLNPSHATHATHASHATQATCQSVPTSPDRHPCWLVDDVISTFTLNRILNKQRYNFKQFLSVLSWRSELLLLTGAGSTWKDISQNICRGTYCQKKSFYSWH